jgi:hypothetical protein
MTPPPSHTTFHAAHYHEYRSAATPTAIYPSRHVLSRSPWSTSALAVHSTPASLPLTCLSRRLAHPFSPPRLVQDQATTPTSTQLPAALHMRHVREQASPSTTSSPTATRQDRRYTNSIHFARFAICFPFTEILSSSWLKLLCSHRQHAAPGTRPTYIRGNRPRQKHLHNAWGCLGLKRYSIIAPSIDRNVKDLQ